MEYRVLDEDTVGVLKAAGPRMQIVLAPLSLRLRKGLLALGVEVVADAAE